MRSTILITRPEMAGLKFADQVRARLGCEVSILLSPVMRIEFSENTPDLTYVTTLIFTSRNGVTAFCRSTPRRDIPCYCVGDATAQYAADEGLNAMSGGGTANDIAARIIADHVAGPCLHIRGEHGVGDVAKRLSDAGIPTREEVMYRQEPEALSLAAQTLLQGEEPVVLPLFSPRTARLVFSSAQIAAPLKVVALSENVAANVPDAHAGTVCVAAKPEAQAVLDAVEALVRAGKPLEGRNLAQ